MGDGQTKLSANRKQVETWGLGSESRVWWRCVLPKGKVEKKRLLQLTKKDDGQC